MSLRHFDDKFVGVVCVLACPVYLMYMVVEFYFTLCHCNIA